jgi:RNA polymerase-binding transcription factor DksA
MNTIDKNEEEYGANERMADENDRASLISEQSRQDALAAFSRANKPEQTPDANGVYPVLDCVGCEEPLEQHRLQLGKIRCVPCQEAKEKRGQYGR